MARLLAAAGDGGVRQERPRRPFDPAGPVTAAARHDVHALLAEAFGGAAENGAGGQATGGTAEFFGNGLTLNAASGGAWISAYALGGNSIDGAGGSATGGSSQVSLSNGASTAMTWQALMRRRPADEG